MTGPRPRRTTLVTIVSSPSWSEPACSPGWLAGQLAIDACLDGGGRWSRERARLRARLTAPA